MLAFSIIPNIAESHRNYQRKAVTRYLLVLKVDNDSKLTVNGETIPVSLNGKAIVGFHRDEKEPLHLIETLRDGSKKELILEASNYEFTRTTNKRPSKKYGNSPRKGTKKN